MTWHFDKKNMEKWKRKQILDAVVIRIMSDDNITIFLSYKYLPLSGLCLAIIITIDGHTCCCPDDVWPAVIRMMSALPLSGWCPTCHCPDDVWPAVIRMMSDLLLSGWWLTCHYPDDGWPAVIWIMSDLPLSGWCLTCRYPDDVWPAIVRTPDDV